MTVLVYILLVITEYRGQVVFNGVPVPGATVTVTQGEKKFKAITEPAEQTAFWRSLSAEKRALILNAK